MEPVKFQTNLEGILIQAVIVDFQEQSGVVRGIILLDITKQGNGAGIGVMGSLQVITPGGLRISFCQGICFEGKGIEQPVRRE
jgi:hypothetical protein